MWQWKLVTVFLLTYIRTANMEEELPDDTATEDNDNPRVFVFICVGLLAGSFLRSLMKVLNIPLPFRVIILFLGGALGLLRQKFPVLALYVEAAHLSPHYILMLFLPLLMFKTAFCLDSHTFMRSWGQIFLLAVPGVIINACFTGMIMMLLLNQGRYTYAMGILFGALCSPINPVEVVTLLSHIGQAKRLSILLEGEGMMGDGTVIMLYKILLGVIDGDIVHWYHILMVFGRFALGGIVVGFGCGKILSFLMGVMYNDVVNLSILTVVASYLSYYIGEQVLSVSGVIIVVVVGIMASVEKTSLSLQTENFLVKFWDMLSFMANTMVFLIAGVLITEWLTNSVGMQDCALILVTYVVAGIGRLIAHILLAPIISRIGYGQTFRNMTVAVWSGLRGPVPFCLALSVYHHPDLQGIGKELLIHIAALVTLTLCINATTMPVLLKVLGLSEMSMARKVNMKNCMRHLCNRRDRTISMLKMDRFLADANWPMVHTATVLKHPYKISYESDEEEENYLGLRLTVCPDCQKEIPNEPTAKELFEMIREARMRILKAKKISYSRQYENGMLSKETIRVLTQAVETAMDSSKALIELEGLHKCFKRQGFVHYTRRWLLAGFFKKSENAVKPPRKYWRRVCYHIIMHSAFDIFIYICVVLNVIPITVEMGMQPKSGSRLSTGLKITNTVFYLVYFVEFILKIYGYSWIYVCQHGFKTYFASYWNIFDFLILCAATVDLTLDYVDLFSTTFNKSDNKASQITQVSKLLRVIRLIRLFRLCKAWYPKLIQYCDSKIDKHLAFAYDVGKGFVTGEEEVSDMLIQMIDNRVIREDCRQRMEADRLAVTKELGLVQKDRPWIAITVKTRQAIQATLNSMAEEVVELKVSGWVDDVEYGMLMESLDDRMKFIRTKVKSVQPSPPKTMFKEVPWMADDESLADFLYEHVVTKVFDQGEVVCYDGQMSDGVYIIVTGLFKLTYFPKREVLDRLVDFGGLPIIDYISSTRFDEKVEDYIVSGNCIGELSALTGRPYDCTITADTSSQAYILTHDIIKQAFQRSADPINGLESKMWKSISIRLATSVLMDTPAYQTFTQEKIRFQLERAFIPKLSNYKIFSVNDMMEDIVLIEGVAFDYNTRDCYTAPCYIPRTVQKIVLPKSSYMSFQTTIETKLLIIPAKDVDEFDIMDKEEDISEMVSTTSSKCLQHVVQDRQSRLKRRRKRQTMFSMGHRRAKYGESHTSATQSVFMTRSRITNTSNLADETEIRSINMYDQEGNAVFDGYVLNERQASILDHRINKPATEKRMPQHRPSVQEKPSVKETTPDAQETPPVQENHDESKDGNESVPEKPNPGQQSTSAKESSEHQSLDKAQSNGQGKSEEQNHLSVKSITSSDLLRPPPSRKRSLKSSTELESIMEIQQSESESSDERYQDEESDQERPINKKDS